MAARDRRFVESGNGVFDVAEGDSEQTQRCHISMTRKNDTRDGLTMA